MTSPTEKTASPDINAVCKRLEGMRGKGYFSQPRNLSNVWCQLQDDGHLVDRVMLGGALYRMSERGSLLRTLFSDGLLSYVDIANAGHWQNIEGPDAGPAAAG